MEKILVWAVIRDTVVQETWEADRITFQHETSGFALINLWQGERRVRQISYREVERLFRTEDAS